MASPFTRVVLEALRRAAILTAALLVCLPAARLEASPLPIANIFWGATGACLDRAGATGLDAVTLAVEAHVVRESLADDEDAAGCGESEAGADPSELCSKLPDPEEAAAPDAQQPAFVAASLEDDILPLEPEDPYMCSASSEDPDRCESSPPLPGQLLLEAAGDGATWRPLTRRARPPTRVHTLPLQLITPRSLLGPATGWARAPDQPPRS